MKVELDDCNYEGMIGRLAKGQMQQKVDSLKKLLFLYDNARSRIYLYERRITQSLELLLLIEQNDVSFLALTLLQKIIIGTSIQSDIMMIIKKRLLSKVILNLGSIQITVRKISHKCILEYIRKFKDYQTLIGSYLKTAINQTQNYHLKLKSINSLHSLLMTENKYFSHNNQSVTLLLEQLISSAYQQQHHQIHRASLLSLIYLLRLDGSQKSLKLISANAQRQLYQLTFISQQLATLLQLILKHKSDRTQKQSQSEPDNAPSPKFVAIEQQQKQQNYQCQKIPQMQLKTFNDVTNAQQFLKRIQKTANWNLQQIQHFAQYIERYLIDQSIKLFSISKKIVEVVFDSEQGRQKEYYIILVPCVVNGVGNKRFIVRKNLDKLVRQYLKNHTQVWVENFIERFAVTSNYKVKQILMDLLIHAYKTSPEFYFPSQRAFKVLDQQIIDKNSHLKWKAIDCILLIIERHGFSDKIKQQMLIVFTPDVYNKVLRKMGKINLTTGSQRSGLSNQPLSPTNIRKNRNAKRLITDQTAINLDKNQIHQSQRKDNVSQGKSNVSEGKSKVIIPYRGQRKSRKSQADIDFKARRLQLPGQKKSKQQRTSIQKLPQVKRGKGSYLSKNQEGLSDSPIKKSMAQKNIVYVERENLKEIDDPKGQLQKTLIQIRDTNWNTQFDSVHCLRSIIQYHKQVITEQYLSLIVNELLICLNSLRSGVSKISLMCLGQLMKKFNKKMYPFTENIVSGILKKSLMTSQFIQDQIRKSLQICLQQLCTTRLIGCIHNLKDNKCIQIKMNILLIIDGMIGIDKIYKKQFQWIWNMLIQFHQEPQNNLRNQCKKIIKNILEKQKDWKNDVIGFKKCNLQKIQKILKCCNQKGNIWIENQNHQFQKILANKVMTSKYFANQYSKFQEQDRNYTLKKNWKDRIKLLNQMFTAAFQHPSQFEANMNAKKYLWIACQQIDEKNPGLLLNAINILSKAIDSFPNIVQESIGTIIQKNLMVLETKRAQLVTVSQRILNKIYKKYDSNKVIKQLLKLTVGNNPKIKIQALTHIINMLKQNCVNSNIETILLKVMVKLSVDKTAEMTQKLKQLINLSTRKLGPQFSTKLSSNEKLAELIQ